MAELTEEQQKFLDECEKEFSLRYTDEDREFMKVKNAVPVDPPAVQPWFPKRQDDGPRQNHQRRENNMRQFRDYTGDGYANPRGDHKRRRH